MDMFISSIIVLLFVCLYVDMQDVVSRCPLDEQSWIARSEQFDCPITLMYHCLKNNKGELVELCHEVTSFNNKEGCPIFVKVDGRKRITNRKCPVTTDPNRCPENNSTGMFLSYETYKYPSCIAINIAKTERTTELTQTTATECKNFLHLFHLNGTTSKSGLSPSTRMDNAKKKRISVPDTLKDVNSGVILIAVVVAVALVSVVGVAGDYVFMRRGLELEEDTTEDL